MLVVLALLGGLLALDCWCQALISLTLQNCSKMDGVLPRWSSVALLVLVLRRWPSVALLVALEAKISGGVGGVGGRGCG